MQCFVHIVLMALLAYCCYSKVWSIQPLRAYLISPSSQPFSCWSVGEELAYCYGEYYWELFANQQRDMAALEQMLPWRLKRRLEALREVGSAVGMNDELDPNAFLASSRAGWNARS